MQMDYLTSALRELEEELGIKAEPEQLHFMGLHEGKYEEIFYGKPFKNHEISHVYLYSEPINIKELIIIFIERTLITLPVIVLIANFIY